MTIDEYILEFRQKSYEFEHAMCDEGTPEERKFYQTKWEHYKQLADWLEESKKMARTKHKHCAFENWRYRNYQEQGCYGFI